MALSDKYICETLKATNPGDPRIELSDEAYAICEMIELMVFRLNNLIK